MSRFSWRSLFVNKVCEVSAAILEAANDKFLCDLIDFFGVEGLAKALPNGVDPAPLEQG